MGCCIKSNQTEENVILIKTKDSNVAHNNNHSPDKNNMQKTSKDELSEIKNDVLVDISHSKPHDFQNIAIETHKNSNMNDQKLSPKKKEEKNNNYFDNDVEIKNQSNQNVRDVKPNVVKTNHEVEMKKFEINSTIQKIPKLEEKNNITDKMNLPTNAPGQIDNHVSDNVDEMLAKYIPRALKKIDTKSPNLQNIQKIYQLKKEFPHYSHGISLHAKHPELTLILSEIGQVAFIVPLFDNNGSKNENNQCKIFFDYCYDVGTRGMGDETIDFSPSGDQFLITAPATTTIIICNFRTYKQPILIEGIGTIMKPPTVACWSSESTILVCLLNGNLEVYDVNQKKCLTKSKISEFPLLSLHINKEKYYSYVGDEAGELFKINSKNLAIEWNYQSKLDKIYYIASSNNMIAFGGDGEKGVLIVLNETTKELIYNYEGQSNSIYGIFFSPSGDYLIMSSWKEVYYIDIAAKSVELKITSQNLKNEQIMSANINWNEGYMLIGTKTGLLYKVEIQFDVSNLFAAPTNVF